MNRPPVYELVPPVVDLHYSLVVRVAISLALVRRAPAADGAEKLVVFLHFSVCTDAGGPTRAL